YRVWGLMPGDYYVNAVARGAAFGGPFGAFGGPGGPGGPGGGPGGPAVAGRAVLGGRGGRGGPAPGAPVGNDQEQTNYAPTYFPGVGSVNEGKPVLVCLSQGGLHINFNMQLVPGGRLAGRAWYPDAQP